MKPVFLRVFAVFLIAFFCYASSAQVPCNISGACGSISAAGGVGGQTIFCEGQTVPFYNQSDPASVDSSFIDWGDGSPRQAFSGTPDVTHTYDFPNDTCVEQIGIIITLTVIRHCANGVSRHCSFFPLAIKFPPVPKFLIDGDFCVGEPIVMDNRTCENADSTAYEWDFDNGTPPTSTEFNPTVTYNMTGFYTITLAATNDCGTVDTQRIIQIRDKPVIHTIFDTLMPSSGCVPTVVHFGASTTFVTGYNWSVSSDPPCNNCWEFVDSTTKNYVKPHIRFNQAGVYTVLLTATNECGTDTMSVLIVIHDPPSVAVQTPDPACNSLSFTPNPVYSGTITSYNWSFPKGSPSSSNLPYPTDILYTQSDTAILTVTGPCGTMSDTIPIIVFIPSVVIFQPVGIVCDHYAPFQLQVTPQNGTFSGPGVTMSGLFDPAQANLGPNVIHYEQGPAGCQSTGDLVIDVAQGTPVSIGADTILCINNGPLTLAFNPAGGTWSGSGIANDTLGIFNPVAAGQGPWALTYTYTDPATQCVSTGSQSVGVVAIPSASAPDTVVTCELAGTVLLPQIGAFTFLPAAAGSSLFWAGPGIVDAQTGVFSSNMAGGVGSYDLTVTYTIPPGCDSTVSFVVQVDAFVTAQMSAPAQLCNSLGTYQLMATPGSGIFSGPGVNPGTGIIDLTISGTGLKNYTYTIQGGTLCENTATVSIDIIDAAGINAGDNIYVCETDDVATLPVGQPLSGAWSGPAAVNGNTADISTLMPGSYTYYYTVSSLPPACNQDSITLTVAPIPDAGFSHDSTGCIGDSIPFFPNTTSGVFDWNFGNTGTSMLAEPKHVFPTEGDFDVTLQVTTINPLNNQALCTNNAVSTIHIYEPPQAFDFQVDPDTGCAILTVSFTNSSIAESGTYLWDFGNGETSTLYQPGPVSYDSGIEDTTYTVTLYLFTPCDTLEKSRPIKVLPRPTAAFGITYDEPCSGGTLLANNTSTGNPAINTWTIIDDSVTVYNSFNPPPLVFFTGADPKVVTIKLLVTNPCGADSAIQQITVLPTDVIALIHISDTSAVCAGDTLTLTSFSTPGAPVHWLDSEMNTYLGDSIAVSFPEAGTYTVTLFAEGCGYDKMDVTFTVQPLPALTVTHDAVGCEGAAVEFGVLTDAPGHTLWFGDGAFSPLNHPVHIYDTAGTYFLQAEAVSLKGCRQVWSGPLVVASRPVSAVAVADSACAGQTIPFSSVGSGGTSCIWTFGDGIFGDDCQTSHTYAAGGLYSATLVVVSDLGCRDTSTQPVYVRPTPAAGFSFQITEQCSPGRVLFQSISTGATGLEWQLGDNTTSVVPVFEKTYAAGGDYLVRLVASYENICFDTATATVTIFQTPSLDITLDKYCTVAEGTDMSITTSGANWTLVTGPGYQQTGDFHAHLPEGDYFVEIKSPEGCLADTVVTILEPNELFIAVLQDSFDIRLGESVELEVTANQSNTTLLWSPPSQLDDPAANDPTATPWQTTLYTVTATSGDGCSKTDTVYIHVDVEREKGIFIPDAFTPNSDGSNELFRLRSSNPALTRLAYFRIVDKWGSIMHDVADCTSQEDFCGWDGNLRGQKAEAGVYRYEMLLRFIDGVELSRTGSFLLIR